MSIYPNNNLSSVLNFDLNSFYNNFVFNSYTITLIKQIKNNNNLIIEN